MQNSNKWTILLHSYCFLVDRLFNDRFSILEETHLHLVLIETQKYANSIPYIARLTDITGHTHPWWRSTKMTSLLETMETTTMHFTQLASLLLRHTKLLL